MSNLVKTSGFNKKDIATDQNIIDKTVGALIDAARIAPDNIINVNSDVKIPTVNAVKGVVDNAISITNPSQYEYAFIQPFNNSTVPAVNGDFEFNSFGDKQLRTVQGIIVNTNNFTLAQGGMFKVEASIKPDSNANGVMDYAFHDGTGFIGKIGTVSVNGSDKTLDVHAIAFVNTSSNSKNITLRKKAGTNGFNFDTNGTAITIQRTAG